VIVAGMARVTLLVTRVSAVIMSFVLIVVAFEQVLSLEQDDTSRDGREEQSAAEDENRLRSFGHR
jgi:hypothetical protein